MNIDKAKEQLEFASPKQIIDWAFSAGEKPIVTTNFGPFESVILHLATQCDPSVKVVWIDSGYNLKKTYQFAEKLIDTLNLNVEVYTPKVSASRQDTVFGGVPDVEAPSHKEFTETFKLEPFRRAMETEKPDVWLTAIRKDQTEFRKSQTVVSQTASGLIKVAPLLNWTEEDMRSYVEENNIPNEEDYYDPTKVIANRECGLHLEN